MRKTTFNTILGKQDTSETETMPLPRTPFESLGSFFFSDKFTLIWKTRMDFVPVLFHQKPNCVGPMVPFTENLMASTSNTLIQLWKWQVKKQEMHLKLEKQFDAHENAISTLAVWKNGPISLLVSGSFDTHMRFWNTNGELVYQITNTRIASTKVWKDKLVTRSLTGEIKVWNIDVSLAETHSYECNEIDMQTYLSHGSHQHLQQITKGDYHSMSPNEERNSLLNITDQNASSQSGNNSGSGMNKMSVNAISSLGKYNSSFFLFGNQLWVGLDKIDVYEWSEKDTEFIFDSSIEAHAFSIKCFCEWNKHVVSGAKDKTIKVWNPSTKACIRTLQCDAFEVWSLCVWRGFLCAGLLTSSDWQVIETEVRIWNWKGEVVKCFKDMKGYCKLYVWDDYLFASTSMSGLLVWKAKLSWAVQRVLWIGWMKHSPQESNIAKLPKELLRHIFEIIYHNPVNFDDNSSSNSICNFVNPPSPLLQISPSQSPRTEIDTPSTPKRKFTDQSTQTDADMPADKRLCTVSIQTEAL